ncbi:MAG: glycosyltransferase [Proteobacteria bacterium]|nr:glycosyltransferase [Pseudomonadota bacterium]
MKVAYIFDEIMPSIVTESMQPMNVLSGLANIGCECTLFIPASNVDTLPTADELLGYYNVDGHFNVEFVHSIYPGPRQPQKVVHPLVCTTLLRKKLEKFDVIYSRNIPAVSAAVLAGLPAVLDTYRPWPEQYHQAVIPVFRLLFRAKHFLGMTTHSEYVRQSFINIGFDPEKICTAHNGYTKSHFEPVLTKAQAREKLGIAQDAKVATYSGRFDMRKGLDHLIALAKARPDVQFIFIGAGYELGVEGEFEREAGKLPNCMITGWKKYNELPAYLYASDVLLIPPSLGPLKKAGHTVLPIKVYIYLASGRAIYAPAAPDTAEILENGRNAYLVSPDDQPAEIEGFSRLIDDAALQERLGAGAASDAAHLTWEARAEVFCDFVRRRKQAMGIE